MDETTDQKVVVGIGPRGIMIRVTEGEVSASAYLPIDEAYAHCGHVNAAAITLEQSAYVQQMQQRAEAEQVLRTIKKDQGKLWTP